ncbi:hypothetical protein WG907_03245 [Sphingobium sp. AN558]|uniref:hypothetical protein n=1 Tax=Sphingobium sp. AN558 TaxID=3133442 RepID=UPI0030C0F6EA
MANGIVTTDLGGVEKGTDLLLQADGKLLAAGTSDGSFAIARYNANGTIDSNFGVNGKVIAAVGASQVLSGLALQSDGKIVAGGTVDGNFGLIRFNPDGSLDTSFDSDGRAMTDLGGSDQLNDITIQADGKILAVGTNGIQTAIVRYNVDGSLDSSFGDNGVSIKLIEVNKVSTAQRVIQANDGSIYVAGITGPGPTFFNPNALYVSSIAQDGAFDTDFSSDGILIVDPNASGAVQEIRADAANNLLLSVVQGSGFGASYSLYSLDGAGIITDSTTYAQVNGAGITLPGGIAFFPDGKLAATTPNSVYKFDSDLNVDTQFNGYGFYPLTFLSISATDIVYQKDGQVVVLGSGYNNNDFTLVRLNANGSLDAHFGIAPYQHNLITGTEGPDMLTGTVAGDEIHGLGGNDGLGGGDGDDLLFGGDGDDTLNGHLGNDILDGGAGSDTAYYANSLYPVTVDLGLGLVESGGAGLDTLISIENVVGGQANDRLRGDAQANILSGGKGSDVLFGGGGDDILIGGVDNDFLNGGAGADILDGTGGTFTFADYTEATGNVAAYLTWMDGNAGEAAGDRYINIKALGGSNFDDILSGDEQTNNIQGGNGNDWLLGQGGNDNMVGGSGNDVLIGGAGADYLVGSAGIDVAYYRDAGASLFTVAQFGQKQNLVDGRTYGIALDLNDIANSFGDAANDTILEIENIWGSAHNDVIRAGNVGGQVYGFEGDDFLDGRGGNDSIYGGAGLDVMTGGSGVDDFFYLSFYDHVNAFGGSEPNEGGDTITDFLTGVDHITVSRYWFGFGNIAGPAAALTTDNADFVTNGTPASARPTFLWNTATRELAFDGDGDAAGYAPVLLATLSGTSSLALADIWTA